MTLDIKGSTRNIMLTAASILRRITGQLGGPRTLSNFLKDWEIFEIVNLTGIAVCNYVLNEEFQQ